MYALLPLCSLYLHLLIPACFSYPHLACIGVFFACSLCLLHRPLRRPRYALTLLLLLTTYVVVGWASARSEAAWAFDRERIIAVEGVLVEDSALSRTIGQVLRLRLTWCAAVDGNEGEGRGIVGVITTLNEPLYATEALRLEGRFVSDSLFVANRARVLESPSPARLRRRIIASLEQRLASIVGQGPTKSLAAMLILGQSDSEGFALKDLALLCGCAHTLALSGMHLSFFMGITTTLLSLVAGKRWAKRLALIPPTLFVGLAGPKPSLVRALLFRYGLLFPIDQAAIANLAFLIQLVLAPHTVNSPAALYSWAAFSALLGSSRLPPFGLRTTAFAILATAPSSIIYSGSWNAMGLLFSLPVTALIAAAMALSLLVLVGISPCALLLMKTTDLLFFLLGWGALHSTASDVTGYLIYASVLLTMVGSIGYAETLGKRHRRHRYEMGVRVRFTEGDHSPVGGARLCDDEEVWTELSAVKSDPRADRELTAPSGRPTGP